MYSLHPNYKSVLIFLKNQIISSLTKIIEKNQKSMTSNKYMYYKNMINKKSNNIYLVS